MGFLTTITIYNDRLHDFMQNPNEFAKQIMDGINLTGIDHLARSRAGGFIKVQASKHADDETLYIHKGNSLTALDRNTIEDLREHNPEILEEYIKSAEQLLKYAKKLAKEKAKAK